MVVVYRGPTACCLVVSDAGHRDHGELVLDDRMGVPAKPGGWAYVWNAVGDYREGDLGDHCCRVDVCAGVSGGYEGRGRVVGGVFVGVSEWVFLGSGIGRRRAEFHDINGFFCPFRGVYPEFIEGLQGSSQAGRTVLREEAALDAVVRSFVS
jgi:hypothetical protein